MGKRSKRNIQSSGGTVSLNQVDKANSLSGANPMDSQSELDDREDSLRNREAVLKEKEKKLEELMGSYAEKESKLNDKYTCLVELELQAKNGFPAVFEEKYAPLKKQLEQRENNIVSDYEAIEVEKTKLMSRDLEIKKSEIKRDNGYADERTKLDDELFAARTKQLKELEGIRSSCLLDIEKEVFNERESKMNSLKKILSEKSKEHDGFIQKENDSLNEVRSSLIKTKAKLDELKDDLDYQKKRLQSRKDSLDEREKGLKSEVDLKVEEKEKTFDHEKSAFQNECQRLRESIKTSNELIANFEELKCKLGAEDPAKVLLKLKTYEEDISHLRKELASRPSQEMQEAFDRIKLSKDDLQLACERLSEDNENLRSSARKQSELEVENSELSYKNKSLEQRFISVDADNNRLSEELKRLKSSYERKHEREDRIRDIEAPYIQKALPRAVNSTNELEWLNGIRTSCTDYGLKFPRRILHAFHTALKTSEWSPITVLAGVSGTGKSELPRLYSHFGGVNFLNLSVQPNWDSQESMLGFFNSIDNKFDAQPVLRLLAQSQKAKSDDYPFGLEDVMSLILMDEMNLAHVELYFAEFLSKLELRRGRKGHEVPCLEVKLGAGIQHYDLPLGRNVLWAGTMNQDETTKSLSDKVLDRGIVINFPRPTTLERRRKLKPLEDHAPLLSRKLWESWWCKESTFSDKQILPFKGFVEEMNTSLSKVGRALGHRVWQSIEYYMANSPDVMEAQRNNDDVLFDKAMKVAFEDQLVQKVMPKLRGIETRGKSKSDCLDKIRTQLVNNDYSIIEDFDLACEFGYGQFIWNSANYLKVESDFEDKTNQQGVNTNTLIHHDLPENIPEQLSNYAKTHSKELWSLTINDIKTVMSCSALEAKKLKEVLNGTKGQ